MGDERRTEIDDAMLDLWAARELALRAAAKLDALSGAELAEPIHAALIAAEQARARAGRVADALAGDETPHAPPPSANGVHRPPATDDTLEKIAGVLRTAGEPVGLTDLCELVGRSQPVVSGRLRRHSGTDAPAKERYFARVQDGWVLTGLGLETFPH